jgi:hypothetical protein
MTLLHHVVGIFVHYIGCQRDSRYGIRVLFVRERVKSSYLFQLPMPILERMNVVLHNLGTSRKGLKGLKRKKSSIVYICLFYALKVIYPRDTQSSRQFSNDLVREQYTRMEQRMMHVSALALDKCTHFLILMLM